VQALIELKSAIDLLDPVIAGSETVQTVPKARAVLRVIHRTRFHCARSAPANAD
jgi:hypothetical protein